jgi:tetratricopeptide (TPR) repeat protein
MSNFVENARGADDSCVDFFISHAGADRKWAEWIAAQLEHVGYSTILDVRDWMAGQDFVELMEIALTQAEQTIAVVTQAYLRPGSYSAAEWRLAFTGSIRKNKPLIPVLVEECDLPALLRSLIYIDLIAVDAETAKRRLLDGVARERPRSEYSVSFPGDAQALPRFPRQVPAVWGSIPLRNAYFTGRDGMLLRLRERLASGTAALVPQTLHGIAGVGKTQLAIEYAHRFASEYDIVWWIPSEQSTSPPSALVALAPHLEISSNGAVAETLPRVLDSLRRGMPYNRWLLIYDNASDLPSISEYLPAGGGDILITSRSPNWGPIATPMSVDVFNRDESIELLRRHLPLIAESEASRLAEALGDLPVAIEQAAAWLSTTGIDATTYLQLLETRLMLLLEETVTPDYPLSLAATWSISIQRLSNSEPAAVQLLQICAFLAPEPVPLSLFMGAPSKLFPAPLANVVNNPIAFGRVIRALGELSLARIASDSFQLHRLVQAVLRDRLDPLERQVVETASGLVLSAADPKDPDNPANWTIYSALLPHAAADLFLDNRIQVAQSFLFNEVVYLYVTGDYPSGRSLAVSIREKLALVRDKNDPDLLRAGHLIALMDWALGDYERARALQAETLEGYRRVLGADDFHTLRSAHCLATALQGLGDYVAALDLVRDTLDRRTRTAGEDDEDSLRYANTLAVCLFALGDYEAARLRDQETYARRKRVLGPDHPDTLASANNLANDLRALGELEESRVIEQETLERRRRVLGDDHPHTLRSKHSLGLIHYELGDYGIAREFLEDALQRRRRVLGYNHAQTLATAQALALLLSADKDYAKARSLAEDTLRRRRVVLGSNHPHTIRSIENLIKILGELGEVQQAVELQAEVTKWIQASDVLGDRRPHERLREQDW